MVLAVLGPDLLDRRVEGVAKGVQAVLDHPEAAVRHDRALQRRVGLEADDDFGVAVDVARRVRGDRRGAVGGGVEDALGALDLEEFGELGPDSQGAGGRSGEEGVIPEVGGIVRLDEAAYVDALHPFARHEILPGLQSDGVGNSRVHSLTPYRTHDSCGPDRSRFGGCASGVSIPRNVRRDAPISGGRGARPSHPSWEAPAVGRIGAGLSGSPDRAGRNLRVAEGGLQSVLRGFWRGNFMEFSGLCAQFPQLFQGVREVKFLPLWPNCLPRHQSHIP